MRQLNWKEKTARAKKMTDEELFYAINDCHDCIQKGVVDEGYYFDEAQVYETEIQTRRALREAKEKVRTMRIAEAFGTVVTYGVDEIKQKVVIVGSDADSFVCKDLKTGLNVYINYDCVGDWKVQKEPIMLGRTK